MQQRGYEIVPVYPRGDEILGERAYPSLLDVPGKVDLVNVFRQPAALAGVVEDALAIGAPALWFQLGCVDEAAAHRARDAGLSVVMDRCLMVDHMAYLGRRP
jgi:predicted CoA-binding protein